jgi:uncharacterized protein (TIGR00369 family)
VKGASFSETLRTGGEIHPPAADLVGFRMLSYGDGEARFEMEAGRRHHNPMGTVHGGILCTLADSAIGMAFASTLGDGETFTSLELKINFLRPVFEEKLYAAAKVVHRGRSVGLVECDVATEDGKLVARAVSTCSVLRGDAAKGR